MFVSHLVCSDRDCLEERELVVGSLEEIESQVCECGHGFVLVSVAEFAGPPAQVVPLSRRLPAPRSDRRAA